MHEFFIESVFFGVSLTLATYGIGMAAKRRFRIALCNPLLIAVVLTMGIVWLLDVDYTVYKQSTQIISYLLTPATVCLAIPLYEQWELLKKNPLAIGMGILSGVLTSLCSVLALSWVFSLDHSAYVTLLPKSITTAIGIGVSEELGGHVSITVAVIILTGILGNMMAGLLCKLCHITHPIAKGIAIGSASHVIGTTKALEMGPVEGAMSSLSIVVSGLLTVVFAGIFAPLYGI